MKKIFSALFCLLSLSGFAREWSLRVDDSGRYLQYQNGEPFFWLGETGWLLPERLQREEAVRYLDACEKAGFNVVQVQTINGVPATNAYGATSDTEGYWEHMDFIIRAAEERGIYIGMVCVWGGLVKSGRMDADQARAYGTMLANRYKDSPNIVWIIGGDIYGDVKQEVWETLATTIKGIDKNHLMTFHPFGRHISSLWFHQAEWLDFNMFQSGHRCYGQSMAKKNPERPDLLPDSTEEDNWRYVELALACEPAKPVVDGEPSYEGIPYGLHDYSLPFWQDYDVRRYAYWSVFAGSFGHTYGNSAIMQMHSGNGMGGYGCRKSWQEALNDPGFSQMQYLKKLMLAFSHPENSTDRNAHPYFSRCPDQSVIVGTNGERYDHLVACRGNDYLLVYDYNAVPVTVDLTKITGERKRAWWYHTADGWLEEIGEFAEEDNHTFDYSPLTAHDDRVLVVTDAGASYVEHLKQAPGFRVVDPRCEQLTNPIGMGSEAPRLSWKIATHERNVIQTAYRILVASSEEKLHRGEADVWDSGRQASEASVLVPYGGPELKTSTYYYWKVQVWTNLSKKPETSAVGHWLTALRTEKDWGNSRWIGWEGAFPWESEKTNARLSARYLRTEFMARSQVRQAVVHISGLGLYELYLNGRKVGNDVMTPGPTDYRKHILYNTYDVTKLIRNGANGVGVILGSGRYYPMRHNYKPYKWADFGYPKMRMVLIITYEDGRRQMVTSSEQWQLTAQGPIVSNNEFDGEEYDARKDLGNWSGAGYRPEFRWLNAQRVTLPTAPLVAQPNPSMRVVETVRPVSFNRLNDSTFIVDMGQNMTGWIRLKVRGPAGHTVRLRFAEALLPDGSLSMANLRDALVTDLYTLKGDFRGEEWAPRFVTHGFQYVEVTNWPGRFSPDNFTGEFVADEMNLTGTFECSSDILNATLESARRSIRGNYKGMPLDCPQRDERMPWMGDRTMGTYGESYLFDNALFYAKWMDDIADAQRWDGALPDVAPAFWNYYSDCITWPAAFFNTCDMLYSRFGDLRPMEKHFGSMMRYVDYMYRYYYDAENRLMTADKYGDWCMPPESPEVIHSSAPDRITDGRLIATAYFYGICRTMLKYAPLLGRSAEIADYAVRADALREGFNQVFCNREQGGFSNNTVTANILATAYGLADAEQEKMAMEHVRHQIMDVCKGTMSSGIIGNHWLWRTLTEKGYGDIAWQLATTTEAPSFGYMISQGATTIWELWNGDTANPTMNSRNHVMQLGDLLVWCYEDLAGIRSDEEAVAFKKLHMAPCFDIQGCNEVKASYESPYGTVRSHWKKVSDGQLVWNLSVPANTTAEITLPTADRKQVTVCGRNASKMGWKLLRSTQDTSVWHVPSGTYSLIILK